MENHLPSPRQIALQKSMENSRPPTPKDGFQVRNKHPHGTTITLCEALEHPALRTPKQSQPQPSPRSDQFQQFGSYQQPQKLQRLEPLLHQPSPRRSNSSQPPFLQPSPPLRLQTFQSPTHPTQLLCSAFTFDSEDLSPSSSSTTSFGKGKEGEKEKPHSPGKRHSHSRSLRKPRSLSVLVFESAILLLAATTLGLASAYGVQLVRAPLASEHRLEDLFSGVHKAAAAAAAGTSGRDVDTPATAGTSLLRRLAGETAWTPPSRNVSAQAEAENWSVFYNGTMPALSLLFAVVGLVLWGRGSVKPVYSAVVSAALFAGWSVNIGWWVACDWSFVVPPYRGPKTCYQSKLIITPSGLVGMDTALMNAKISFGILMVAVYAAYLSALIFFPVKNSPFARLWKI